MKIKYLALLVLPLFLVACGKTTPQTNIQKPITTNNSKTASISETAPIIDTDTKTEELTIAEIAPVIDETPKTEKLTIAEDELLTGENSSLKDIQKKIDTFKLKNEASFLSCMNYSIDNCQQTTVAEVALNTKSDSSCDLLTDSFAKENCKNQLWNQLAYQDKDTSYCDKMTEKYQSHNCKNQVYTAVATENKDTSICEKITIFVDESLTNDTIENDSTIAVLEVENYEKNNCLEQVKFALTETEYLEDLTIENLE